MLRLVRLLRFLVLAAFAVFVARDHAARFPQDLPWTPLDLNAPIGWATGGKLRALHGDAQCLALLDRAGIVATAVPAFDAGPGCPIVGAVRVRDLGLPVDHDLVTTCPLAAAMTVWSRRIVIPAVRARLGVEATGLTDLGSLNCRRIAGTARMSEHARANAVDIAAVRIGRSPPLTVFADFGGDSPRAAALRDLHAGACRLFGTVLGPDYNAAHRDHFHLDMANWNACR